MTLLVAVQDSSTIWITGDSLHVSMSGLGDAYGSTTDKLYPIDKLLVWGWYGDSVTDWQPFRDFMATETFRDWDDLLARSEPQVTAINEQSPFGVLFAGYLNGESRVCHLGDSGRVLADNDALFCGMCRMAANVGWRAINASLSSLSTENRLNVVMESVIGVSNGVLGSPHTMWRISNRERIQVKSVPEPVQSIRSSGNP